MRATPKVWAQTAITTRSIHQCSATEAAQAPGTVYRSNTTSCNDDTECTVRTEIYAPGGHATSCRQLFPFISTTFFLVVLPDAGNGSPSSDARLGSSSPILCRLARTSWSWSRGCACAPMLWMLWMLLGSTTTRRSGVVGGRWMNWLWTNAFRTTLMRYLPGLSWQAFLSNERILPESLTILLIILLRHS